MMLLLSGIEDGGKREKRFRKNTEKKKKLFGIMLQV